MERGHLATSVDRLASSVSVFCTGIDLKLSEGENFSSLMQIYINMVDKTQWNELLVTVQVLYSCGKATKKR